MNHRPRKRFGQNFLHDPGVIARIVRAVAPAPGRRLVEIGPGQGALTRPLLAAGAQIDAIELDRDLVAQLEVLAQEHNQLMVHSADALRFDFRQLAADGERLRVIGNLPYNISTPLMFHLLDQLDVIEEMVFMLQKEVVDRLAAEPGGGDYGRLSVMVQTRCAVTPLFRVPPGAFFPPPKVESAIVRLRPLPQSLVPAESAGVFAEIVKRAFGQRRKTLRNALRGLVDDDLLQQAGLQPGSRAETVAVAGFARLGELVHAAADADGSVENRA